MNALLAFQWPFSQSVVERLGWVLIHSLWQFAIVALLAGLVARTMRRHSASTRYGVFVVAMSVSVIAVAATWMFLAGDGGTIVVSRVPSNPEWSSGGLVDPRVDAAVPARPAAETVDTEVRMQAIAPSKIASETRPAVSPSAPAIAQPAATWWKLAESVMRPWMAWIVAAWGLGVVFCSVRPLLGWRTLRRLRRVGVSAASDEVLAAMRRVSERLGVRRVVSVLQSTVALVPMVIGYVRPVILLPVGLVTSIPAAQLEAILAHELTHVRRHDFVVNLLQALVETLFFYHPAVWWLSRQIRVEREHCCDDQVVMLLDNRVEYGRALVAIDELRGRNTVLALGATDGPLLSRVRRIVGVAPERSQLNCFARWPMAFVGLVTLALVVTIAFARTENKSNSDDRNGNQPESGSAEQRAANELELLQGFWAVESCNSEAATLNVSEWDARRWRWTIKGNKITWGREGQEWKLMYSVDSTKSPRQIDLEFLDGPHKGKTCSGIYDWVGKDSTDLKLFIEDPGAQVLRPAGFEKEAGHQTSQITLRPLPPVDLKKELALWQGTWSWDFSQPWTWPQPIGVGTDSHGRHSEQRWVVEGNQITWVGQDGERVYVNFTIDPFKAPKQIEFTFLNGPLQGKKSIGIYESRDDEDHRELSMTDPGSDVPRPTYISGSSIAKHSMIVIHRVAPPPERSAATELKRLQGVWQMTLCDSTTEAFGGTQQEVSKWHWTIIGDEILWNRQGDVWKLKLAVEPSKRPRKSELGFVTGPYEMDLTYLTGPFQGSRCGGIYGWGGIDGQSLMIAIQDPGSDAPRPTEFRMRGDVKTGLMILRPSTPSAAERELSALQGTWTLRSLVTGNLNENKDPSSWPIPGGKGPDKSGEGSDLRWVVKDHGITWTSRSGEEIKASFKINTTQRPKQIDLTFLSGPDKGETCLGIYQRDDLDENILWLCLADPNSNSDRPQELSYEWGAGRSLLSFYPFESSAAQSSTEPKSKATAEPDLVPEKREAVIETVAETFLRFEDARSIGTHAKTKYTRLTNDGEEPANRTDLKEGVRVRYEYMTLRRGATKVVILPTKQEGNPKSDGPNGDQPSNEPKQNSRKDQPADAPNLAQNDLEKELALWQGTWSWDLSQPWTWPQPIGVGTDSRGTRKSEKRWTVKGNQITWISQEGRRINVNFTIDPTKTPKRIEFTFLNGPLHGKKSIGIYASKSDEDHRHLCMTDPGSDAPRPTDFSAGTFLNQSIIVIHRVPPPPKPTVVQAIERLQGVWQMEACDSMTDSFGATQQEAKKWQWTIKGDEIVWSRQNQLWKMKLEVDPTKSPNHIDLTYLDGPFQGKKCLGMYVFGGVDGQSLMISIQDPGSDAPRPTSISMRGDVMTSLIFLRPHKPSDTERELGSFQGTWTLRNFDTDFGSWPLPSGEGPDEYGEGSELRWTVKGNEITWTSRTGEETKASFKLDAMKSPKQFDLTFLNGPHKDQTCPGIYQRGDHDPGIYQRGDLLDENSLWLCIADPGSGTERPKDFSYERGKGRSLMSFYAFDASVAQTSDSKRKPGAAQDPVPTEKSDEQTKVGPAKPAQAKAAADKTKAPPVKPAAAQNPTLHELIQGMAAYERMYLPYEVQVMETFRFPEDLTPQEKAQNPRADGRKHQRLMEYAQLAKRIWRDKETDLVDDETEQGPYERFSDGERIVQRGPSSVTINGVTATEYFIHGRKTHIQYYLSAAPLLGVFCLSQYGAGDLFSEAFRDDEDAVELAWDNGDAKLTFAFGKPDWNTRYVLWLSRAHAWHPIRLQRYWDAKDKFWFDEWEVTKFVPRGKLWRVAEGTHRYRDRRDKKLPDPKVKYSMDFKVLSEKYGSDVDVKQFHIEIPQGAKVRMEDQPETEPAPLTKTREIKVTAVDVAGKPIPQASVRLPASPLRNHDLMTTDEQGVARSAKAPADNVTVQISAAGFRPVTWIMGDVNELRAIMVPLSPGVVVDEGKPVADAWVTNESLQIRADGFTYVPNRDWDGRDDDWSNSEGRFELKSNLTLRRHDAVVPIVAVHPNRDKMAIRFTPASDLGRQQELALENVCHIYGHCLFEGMTESVEVDIALESSAGQYIGLLSTRRELAPEGLRVDFQLHLPPGDYLLKSGRSSHHSGFEIPLAVPMDESQLDLGTKTVPATGAVALRGKPAPELELQWRAGEETSWEKLRGNIVVLDFWGTWCSPCVNDMPLLMDVADQFHDKPVQWLSIHTPNLKTFDELDRESRRARRNPGTSGNSPSRR